MVVGPDLEGDGNRRPVGEETRGVFDVDYESVDLGGVGKGDEVVEPRGTEGPPVHVNTSHRCRCDAGRRRWNAYRYAGIRENPFEVVRSFVVVVVREGRCLGLHDVVASERRKGECSQKQRQGTQGRRCP